MSNDVTIYEERPLTAADIREQVNRIQEVMRSVMQEGQHYGKVPGCGDKPTLLKPGAEKIMATFRIAAEPEVVDLSFEDIVRYRVMCRMVSPSGRLVGVGVGECSSEEDKYKWRSAVCDAEFDATPETHRRLKFTRDGKTYKQVRTNPYDLANTILKMAKKRALVDGTLTATAASDCFTQDVEELPEELRGNGTAPSKPAPQPPQKKAPAPSTIKDPDAPASEAQLKAIFAISKAIGITEDDILMEVNGMLNPQNSPDFVSLTSTKELTKAQASTIIEALNKRQKEHA